MTEDNWASTPFPQFTPPQEAEIVRHSPIVEVARDLGIETTEQDDGTFAGQCPWCRAPRLSISPSDGHWTCTACAEGGRDVIVLVAKMQELWRPDALHWLATRAGLHLPAQRIADVSIAQVRIAADIETVIRESGRPVSTAGGVHATRCPLCGSARCEIATSSNQYYCAACDEGGDVFTWVATAQGMSFESGVEYLARRFGITVMYEDAE